MVHRGEEQERGDQAKGRSDGHLVDPPMVDHPPGDEPRYAHANRHVDEEISRIRYGNLASVKDYERKNHAIRNGNQDIGPGRGQGSQEDEPVEREGRPFLLLPFRVSNEEDGKNAQQGNGNAHPYVRMETGPCIEPDGDQGGERHGEVDRQAIKSHSFAPPLGGNHIDGNRVSRYRSQPHKAALEEADAHQAGQRSRPKVSEKKEPEHEEGDKVKPFAREAIHQVTGKGPHTKDAYRVARQGQPHFRVADLQLLGQKDGQSRHQQVEREVHPEIGDAARDEIAVPKLRSCHFIPFHFQLCTYPFPIMYLPNYNYVLIHL